LRYLFDSSGGFDDLARFQAASADSDALDATAHGGPDGLKVGVEATAGAIVGVADAIAELRPLAAYITTLCHMVIPPGYFWYEDKSEV
jgi:hypothetical protein